MSNVAPDPRTSDLDELRQAVDTAVRQALDTDEFRQSVNTVVRQALDNDEFRQAVDNAVRQFLAGARRDAHASSVAREIERAVSWPVRRTVAEAIGFDELAKHGTPESLRQADQARRSIGIAIDAAVRDEIERAFGRGDER
ncbi:hypothetical protein PJI20_10000 [Mycobacterium kansasii]